MADAALTPELAALVGGQQRDPFSLLGPHPTNAGIVIRAIRPDADRIEVRLMADGSLVPMRRLSPKRPSGRRNARRWDSSGSLERLA